MGQLGEQSAGQGLLASPRWPKAARGGDAQLGTALGCRWAGAGRVVRSDASLPHDKQEIAVTGGTAREERCRRKVSRKSPQKAAPLGMSNDPQFLRPREIPVPARASRARARRRA